MFPWNLDFQSQTVDCCALDEAGTEISTSWNAVKYFDPQCELYSKSAQYARVLCVSLTPHGWLYSHSLN